MGEIIKTVTKVSFGGSALDIELNHSASGSKYRDIHIQNDKFRLEIPENEFLSMAACVLLAGKQFDVIKENPND